MPQATDTWILPSRQFDHPTLGAWVTAALRPGVSGLERLVDHPVDYAVPDDRPRDRLGQRACEQHVDHALDLVGECAAERCGAEPHE